MGSLRNPVGPLPSSIYWRRRGVVLSLLAVAAVLVAWVAISGGDGGQHDSGGVEGKHPAPSITPGPSGSGPAISQHPGGRDTSGDGDTSGGDGSTGGGSGSAGGTGGASGVTSGGASGTGGQTGGAGDQVPAGSSLPTCTAGSTTLTLRTTAHSYSPGHNPRFVLTAKNASGTACKFDLGPTHTVLTVTREHDDKRYWASDDCATGSDSLFLRVTAGTATTHTVTWNRKPSAPHCATPPPGSAALGTYQVEAKAPGFPVTRTSFVLDKG